MNQNKQSSVEQPEIEQAYDSDTKFCWFHFPCNVIPFKYDPKQGWLYVHGMQLFDDKRADVLHAALMDMNMGTYSVAYAMSETQSTDTGHQDYYVYAPLKRHVNLTTYTQSETDPSPSERQKIEATYREFVSYLNFEQLSVTDQKYLMDTHQAFKRRLKSRYYRGLRPYSLNAQNVLREDTVQADIEAEIQANRLNRHLLAVYLKHTDLKTAGFDGFCRLIKLAIGASYTQKIEILQRHCLRSEDAECDTADIVRQIDQFKQRLPDDSDYQRSSSKIAPSALRAIYQNQLKLKTDPAFLAFVPPLLQFLQQLINRPSQNSYAAHEQYLAHFAENPLPDFVTTQTLCAVFYAIAPDAFPLTNRYVQAQLKPLVGRIDAKSPEGYITAAQTLTQLLNGTLRYRYGTHFGTLDRILAYASQHGDGDEIDFTDLSMR